MSRVCLAFTMKSPLPISSGRGINSAGNVATVDTSSQLQLQLIDSGAIFTSQSLLSGCV